MLAWKRGYWIKTNNRQLALLVYFKKLYICITKLPLVQLNILTEVIFHVCETTVCKGLDPELGYCNLLRRKHPSQVRFCIIKQLYIMTYFLLRMKSWSQ